MLRAVPSRVSRILAVFEAVAVTCHRRTGSVFIRVNSCDPWFQNF